MRVLVVKLSSLGDIVHALPALAEARAARPDIGFDWVADRPFADFVRRFAGLDVREADTYGARTRLLSPAVWTRLANLRRELRCQRYDLVIDAQGLLRSALVARLAGAPIAGFDANSVREPLAARAYHRPLAVPKDEQAVTRQRQLFAAALGYRSDPATPRPLLSAGPAVGQDAFLLHGSSMASKRWPLPHWVALAQALAQRGLRPRVAWSSPAERDTASALAAAVPGLDVLPRLPLADVAQQVAGARLVVGVDTGLTHVADAVGRPTVMLFQASAPGRTGPTGPRSVALWRGEATTHIRRRDADRPPDPASIPTVAEVLAAVDRLLEADA